MLHLFLDDLFQPSPNAIVVCVADDLFQSSRPGDFDVTVPRTICVFHSDNTAKLLFLDDLFQPSPLLLVSVLLTIFSSPAIVDDHIFVLIVVKYAIC